MKQACLFLVLLLVGCVANRSTPRQGGIHGTVGYESLRTIGAALDKDPMAVNQKDATGMTPLHWAIMRAMDEQKDDAAIVSLLLGKGADPNAKGEFERTPLHLAANGCPRIAATLITASAWVDARDAFGQTPLHRAVLYMSSDVVKVLLTNGADASVKDEDGKTPLVLATEDGDGAILALLKQSMKLN